MAGYSGRADH